MIATLFTPFCPTVPTNVSEVDVPAPTEGGSGSGFEAIEQITSSFEFPLTEDVGQLYSYRLNNANERSNRTVTITVQGTDIQCSCVCRSINSPTILI